MDSGKLRILAFGDMKSGCYWVRVKHPLEELAKHGHTVFLADPNQAVMVENWDIVVFNNLLGTPVEGLEQETEASLKQMVKDFRDAGAKIVYDTDDAQDVHPNYNDKWAKIQQCISSFHFFLKEADLITTTTEHLKCYLQKYTDKPIVVLPNCAIPSEFRDHDKQDKVKIGFAGSPSHTIDIDLALPAINKLKEKHDIYFEIFGFKKDGYKCRMPVRRYLYAEELAKMGNDIGICPLLDDEFNRNKSPIKFYDYALTGSAVLASNRLPYSAEMKREWLCDDDEWFDRLEDLILNEDKRKKMAAEQNKWVLNNRDIGKEYVRWEETYTNLLSGKYANK